jgi:hypothetical protein
VVVARRQVQLEILEVVVANAERHVRLDGDLCRGQLSLMRSGIRVVGHEELVVTALARVQSQPAILERVEPAARDRVVVRVGSGRILSIRARVASHVHFVVANAGFDVRRAGDGFDPDGVITIDGIEVRDRKGSIGLRACPRSR